MTDAELDSSGNHRRSLRVRSLLGGKIVYGDGFFTLDCVIRDISEHGARVKIAEGAALPSTVYFLEVRSGRTYEARVAWRRHPEVGLEFISPCALDEASTADLQVLRRLWNETRSRPGI